MVETKSEMLSLKDVHVEAKDDELSYLPMVDLDDIFESNGSFLCHVFCSSK